MKEKVSVVLPVLVGDDQFLIALTEFCIKTMRLRTTLPYELVLVEAGTRHFERLINYDRGLCAYLHVDKYVHCPERTTVVKDHNTGLRAASGDLLAFIGNDVIVGTGWLEALVEPFKRYKDCGLSSVSAMEPGANIGPAVPVPGLIVEGSYTPIMMFRRGWELDEGYPGGYSDSDLIMRVYEAGLRAYRNCRAQVHHLNHLTIKGKGQAGREEIAAGEARFYERWGGSPLMMYAMIRSGGVAYGREHEFLRRPIVPYMQRVPEGEV